MSKEIVDTISDFKNGTAKLVLDYWKRRCYERWDSSAKKLEETLKKRGIANCPKLYYEYEFPGGLKNFEIEKKYWEVWEQQFRQQIQIKDGRYVRKTEDNLEQTSRERENQIELLADSIWKLNPELQCIKDYKNEWFVDGAIYGFAPKDIDFYIQLARRRETRDISYKKWGLISRLLPSCFGKDKEENHCIDNLHKIAEFTGNWPGYFPAPETSDEILTAIENHEQMQQQNLENGFSIR